MEQDKISKIEKWSFMVMAFGIVIFFALVFGFVNKALAVEVDIVGAHGGSGATNFGRDAFLQEINNGITSGYANKLDIAVANGCSVGCDISLSFCHGTYAGGDFSSGADCTGSVMFYQTGYTVSAGTTTLELPSNYYFDSTQDYYFILHDDEVSTSSTHNIAVKFKAGNDDIASSKIYGRNDEYDEYNDADDMYFSLYLDTAYQPPDYEPSEVFVGTIDAYECSEPSYQFPLEKLCVVGQDCEIEYTYNDCAIGMPIYIMEGIGDWDTTNPDVLFWIPETWDFTGTTSLPSTTAGLHTYNIVLDDIGASAWFKQTINVRWLSQAQLDEMKHRVEDFMQQAGYDQIDPCSDIATSSGSFADDFRYGVQCGFRRVLHWTFVPKPQAWQQMASSTESLLDEFPLNIYHVIWGEVHESGSSTTTQEFVLDMYLGDMDGDGVTTSVEVFRTSDLTDTFGSVWTSIYQAMTVLVFFFGIFYFFNYIQEL